MRTGCSHIPGTVLYSEPLKIESTGKKEDKFMHFLRKIIVLFIATGSLTLGIQNAAAAGMGCSPLNKPSRYTDNRFDRSRSAAPWDFRQAPRPTYRPPVRMGPMPVWNRYARHANPGHGYPRQIGRAHV